MRKMTDMIGTKNMGRERERERERALSSTVFELLLINQVPLYHSACSCVSRVAANHSYTHIHACANMFRA